MIPVEMDDDMKSDLRLIRMRNFLDPKRFYKAPDGLRAILHEGTVIEGRGEYRSRIEKKGRHLSIVDEALYDKKLQSYSKRTTRNRSKKDQNQDDRDFGIFLLSLYHVFFF